jgi:hypothetical protein
LQGIAFSSENTPALPQIKHSGMSVQEIAAAQAFLATNFMT